MDKPPVVLARNGIKVAFAQKSQIVGVFQLRDARRIRVEFPVVKPDSTLVLLAPLDRFFFFIALNVLSHDRRCNRQRQSEQKDKNQHANEQVPVFVARCICGANTQPYERHAQHCIGPGQIQITPPVDILRSLLWSSRPERSPTTCIYPAEPKIPDKSFLTRSVSAGMANP